MSAFLPWSAFAATYSLSDSSFLIIISLFAIRILFLGIEAKFGKRWLNLHLLLQCFSLCAPFKRWGIVIPYILLVNLCENDFSDGRFDADFGMLRWVLMGNDGMGWRVIFCGWCWGWTPYWGRRFSGKNWVRTTPGFWLKYGKVWKMNLFPRGDILFSRPE